MSTTPRTPGGASALPGSTSAGGGWKGKPEAAGTGYSNEMRYCRTCDVEWRGPVPCWSCGQRGVPVRFRYVIGTDFPPTPAPR